jgi:hypothetical protein
VILKIIRSLNKNDQASLFSAFDSGLPCVVQYEDGRWVGVNVEPSDTLIVETREGAWSVGCYR